MSGEAGRHGADPAVEDDENASFEEDSDEDTMPLRPAEYVNENASPPKHVLPKLKIPVLGGIDKPVHAAGSSAIEEAPTQVTVCLYICVCMCVCVCIHKHIYICTHTDVRALAHT